MLAYTAGQMAAGVVVNLVVSAIVGLVPFFLGRARGRFTLGLVALVLSIVIGFFLSFIAGIVVALAFTIAILIAGRDRARTAAV